MVGPAEARSVLSWAGELSLSVRGESMGALFRGARMRVSRELPSGSARGRVVLYAEGDRMVAHRVVDDLGSVLVCRGDANRHSERVARRDVLGVMTSLTTRLGPLPLTVPWSLERVLSAPARRVPVSLRRVAHRLLVSRAAG